MKSFAEKEQDLLDRQTREYLDSTAEPEYEECPDCGGTGKEERSCKWHDRECATCNGSGQVIKRRVDIFEEGEY